MSQKADIFGEIPSSIATARPGGLLDHFKLRGENRRNFHEIVIEPTFCKLGCTHLHLLSSGSSGILNPSAHVVAFTRPQDASLSVAHDGWSSDRVGDFSGGSRIQPRLASPCEERLSKKSHHYRTDCPTGCKPLRKGRWNQFALLVIPRDELYAVTRTTQAEFG